MAAEAPRHPVLEVLRARAAGRRDDGARVALAVEGGGMRGVVSAGMTVALDRRGLTSCFDLVVGTSAGALNAAALVAGVAEGCTEAYHEAFATRRFINPYRLVIGRAAIDVAYALDHATDKLPAGRHAAAAASAIALHCVALDVETARTEVLTGMRDASELKAALLASSRIPWVGGAPVEYRGRRYLDGGLAEAIPVDTALRLGATHVLALQTRPWGVPRTPPSPVVNRLIERRLQALNPALVALYRRRAEDYEAAVEAIGRSTAQPEPEGPHVCGIRLPAGSIVISQLERRAAPLREAAGVAERHAGEVLDG